MVSEALTTGPNERSRRGENPLATALPRPVWEKRQMPRRNPTGWEARTTPRPSIIRSLDKAFPSSPYAELALGFG